MTGPRGNNGGGEILRLRELVDMQISDAMWGEIIRTLADTAAEGEKGAIQAAKLLMAYRYGLPNQFTGTEDAPPIHIRTIEVRQRDPKPTHNNRTRRPVSPDGRDSARGSDEGMALETPVRRGDGGDAGR